MMGAGLTAVVDYGLCNIDSMVRALEECGASQVQPTRDPHVLERADRIVLPGVGTFDAGMRNLRQWKLDVALQDICAGGRVPVLGACLGMQLLADAGEESLDGQAVAGLGIVPGRVVPMVATSPQERIPHMGWNEVSARGDSVLLKGLSQADFYFVHSYHFQPHNAADQVGHTAFCGGITSVIEAHGRPVFGTQFHPEKSQRNGFALLKNFLAV